VSGELGDPVLMSMGEFGGVRVRLMAGDAFVTVGSGMGELGRA